MSKSRKKSGEKSESWIWKIIIPVAVALAAGGTSPWWFPKWERPKEPEKPPQEVKTVSRDCDPNVLRDSLFRAGSQKTAFVTMAASTMKNKLGEYAFECVLELAKVLLEQDPDNGHGLYFQGEYWRCKATDNPAQSVNCRDKMREYFLRYLAKERLLPPEERDGASNACYERERGYCKERTAWINHLMAVDYRQWAEEAPDKTTKVKRLELAAGFVKKMDLDFGGFDAVAPSAVLKEKIAEDFQKLGTPYPANP